MLLPDTHTHGNARTDARTHAQAYHVTHPNKYIAYVTRNVYQNIGYVMININFNTLFWGSLKILFIEVENTIFVQVG